MVAFGRFGGERWKFEVYQDAQYGHCFSLQGGRACSQGVDENDYMSLNTSWSNGKGRSIFIGTALPEVKSIRARPRSGGIIDIAIIDVPREFYPWNIYVSYFTTQARGIRIARGADGAVLEREKLYSNSNR